MINRSDLPSDHGFYHESELPDLDHLKDHVQGILDALYKTGSITQLESSLDEVCGELGIPFKPTRPLFERTEMRNLAVWNLGYQRCMLDQSQNGVNK